MTKTLLWLLVLAPAQDEKLETLIERWRSDDPVQRDRASRDILARWKEWKDEGFEKLRDAVADADSEVAARAKDAMARVRIRRRVGPEVMERVKGVDDAFLTGGDLEKLAVLRAARLEWKKGLPADALEGLDALAKEAKWNDEEALSRLLKESEKGDFLGIPLNPAERVRLRARGVERLATEGKAHVIEILPYLKDEEVEVRSMALRMIGKLNAREQAPQVVPLLQDAHSTVRTEALLLLGGWGRKEFARDFAPLLRDPHWQVRWRAAEALGDWGLKEYAREIAPLLQDPYGQTRAEAAAALGELGAKECAAEIARLLRDLQPAARRNAAFALGKLGAREYAEQVVLLLKDDDTWVKMSAAQALGQMGQGEHLVSLLPLLRDNDPEIRSDAAWVLGRVASKDLRKHIAALLDDRDAEVRHDALWALERLGAREYAPDVARLLKDPSGWVRSQAVVTLAWLGTKEDLEAVLALLQDSDRRARTRAALAAGELGARVALADPPGALVRLERDVDRLVALSASVALIRLGLMERPVQRDRLGEIATNSLASAYLGPAMLDALAFAHVRKAYDRLEEPLDLDHPIGSWKDLENVLRNAGFRLEVEGDFRLGRLDKGTHASLRAALEWLLGRYVPPEVVLDGSKVRLMEPRAALDFWQKRLDGK